MAVDGGPAETVRTCAPDGVETRLRCSECEAPICPACFVRTPVGLRCRVCAADAVPVVRPRERGPRWPVFAAIAVVVALIVGGGAWVATRGGDAAPEEAADVGQGTITKVDPVTIGTGDLANGTSWTLVARRDARICITFTTSTGSPRPESCERPPGNRAVSWITRRVVTGPGGTAYVTVGLVSDQVERIRVAPQGALGDYEVATIGGDAGLGGRFFVTETPVNGALVLTAVGANGNQIGRANVSEIRPPPGG